MEQNKQSGISPKPSESQSLYTPATGPAYVGSAQDHQAQAPDHAAYDGNDVISWEASEYVHNDKGSAWLIGLIVVLVIFVGAALFFQQWSFAAIILVMGIAFGVFAFRLPRTLSYKLDDDGVEIDGKLYPYNDFRAFAILEDGAFFTMTLIPIRRFSPAISIYFAETDGERIVDVVGDHLPMEHIEPDLIDTLMRRLRF